jgi:glucose/arabinose dehydrogenase
VRTIDEGNDMSLSSIFARVVALIGAAALLWRRLQDTAPEPAWGSSPLVPAAKPQGSIPTLKMPSARGWSDGQIPVAAPGLKVNAFATGLKHPRWIEVLPNGDVLVAESNQVAGPGQEPVQLRDAGDDAACLRPRREREPHHVAARHRWRWRRGKA